MTSIPTMSRWLVGNSNGYAVSAPVFAEIELEQVEFGRLTCTIGLKLLFYFLSLELRGKEELEMFKALRMDSDTCTGCHQCEMMCSYGKVGAFNPAKSVMNVSLYNGGAVNIPSTCTQCEEAWCMVVCPVEAITINPTTGSKEVSAEVCVGCKVCSIACPYGAINYDADSGVVTKCDLCGGEPMCVEACPTPALAFVDEDSTGYDRIWNHVAAALVGSDSTVRQ